VRRRTPVDRQRSPVPVGTSPSWIRVIVDTIKLSWERRRQFRVQHDDGQRRLRLWIPVLCGLVVLGGGLLVRAAFRSADPVLDAAPPSSEQRDDPTGLESRSPGEPSRAISSRTASLARAAAGAEIAARADIDVSPDAAIALREGTVDGRVLVVLASLATADLITAVDVPPNGSGESTEVTNLEMGVVDVDRVLDWLHSQSRLSPDRMEVRRESSVAYLILIYDTREPPGLFPS
jgi:hypothetical protein